MHRAGRQNRLHLTTQDPQPDGDGQNTLKGTEQKKGAMRGCEQGPSGRVLDMRHGGNVLNECPPDIDLTQPQEAQALAGLSNIKRLSFVWVFIAVQLSRARRIK